MNSELQMPDRSGSRYGDYSCQHVHIKQTPGNPNKENLDCGSQSEYMCPHDEWHRSSI